jgi:hypothetical protein
MVQAVGLLIFGCHCLGHDGAEHWLANFPRAFPLGYNRAALYTADYSEPKFEKVFESLS